MIRSFIFSVLLLFSLLSFCETPNGLAIRTKISDSIKAKSFDKNYEVVLPCHDWYSVFNYFTPDFLDSTQVNGHDSSYILTNTIYGTTTENILVKKTTTGNSILNNNWLMPLSKTDKGYTYLDNKKIITRNYSNQNTKELTVGKEINENFDRHSIVNEGDTVIYFATAIYDRKKKLYGDDTMIIDFDFFVWNKRENKTTFLFSASNIVPDSMLVPDLFESEGIYGKTLDIYHWNWMQKKDNNKLLINFGFCGFMQLDLKTKHVDWAWGYYSSTFSKVKGIGDRSAPYYTHHINMISSGPYKGCYSYFENGSMGDSINPMKPARGRIFKINPSDNSIKIVFEKTFDISSMALGSVDVMDNYVVVNLGMILPLKEILRLSAVSGSVAAVSYVKNYTHPNVYIYDLKGKEISNITYPFGFYSYSAWIKRKAKK